MSDYKNTLNLPKTDFPMKANLSQREPEILKKWEALNLYGKLREQGKKRKRFVFHDGPPYANGHIHMGTALNKILKDIVTKSKTLSGFDAPFVPGWDCHGLPIELNVEKKVGKPGHKISREEFRKACREYATNFINIQREEFKRLGVVADWQHPYLTMDFKYEANIIRSLAKILKNKHLQKGYRPVYWCLDCASALAEAEVEYKDKISPSIDVRFRVVDKDKFFQQTGMAGHKGDYTLSIPIWTTTPWTLPANQAVAVHAELIYVLVKTATECLVIAKPLVESVMQRYGIEQYEILGETTGATLENITLQHPFYDRTVPVICGEHVTVETGTGAVHTAPAHGEDDFSIGKKYQLPIENPVGDDGCYLPSVPLFAGMHVNKVNDLIIETLQIRENLLHHAKFSHSYPHCWRHKTALIFRATPQWFVSLEQNGLRSAALEAIKHVNWIPEWGMSRISSMVENRPDWCISRQRTWGVPIALFIHKETGDLHPDSAALIEKVAERVEKEGVDVWYALDAKELLGKEAEQYTKVTDILDVWFDSGVSNECVLKQNPQLAFPADVYFEGSDQHRGWFQTSLLASIAINGVAPYKTVLTHGYVIDIEGRKMSKSLGNVMAPEKIIQSLGADILRLWVASIDYRNDLNVSEEILSRNAEAYRRLRNTARFLLANVDGFNPAKDVVKPNKMLALDRWAVDRARLVQEEIIQAYHTYQFHTIYRKLHQFCSIDMGSFYLDIIKDRQYTMKTDSLARRSAQTAMYHIVEALVRWMAPILTFTAEEIWQFIPGKREESVFLSTWYTDLAEVADKDMNQEYWNEIRLVRDAVNKEIEAQRNAGKVGSALEAMVDLYCESHLKEKLDALHDELRFVLITSSAKVHLANTHIVEGAIKTEVPGLNVQVAAVSYTKCERCWHRREDVGADAAHPTLCGRCVVNVDGEGEVRRFA